MHYPRVQFGTRAAQMEAGRVELIETEAQNDLRGMLIDFIQQLNMISRQREVGERQISGNIHFHSSVATSTLSPAAIKRVR